VKNAECREVLAIHGQAESKAIRHMGAGRKETRNVKDENWQKKSRTKDKKAKAIKSMLGR
jgi:hypothetical protein